MSEAAAQTDSKSPPTASLPQTLSLSPSVSSSLCLSLSIPPSLPPSFLIPCSAQQKNPRTNHHLHANKPLAPLRSISFEALLWACTSLYHRHNRNDYLICSTSRAATTPTIRTGESAAPLLNY